MLGAPHGISPEGRKEPHMATDKTPAQAEALLAFMSAQDMSTGDVLAALTCLELQAASLAEELGRPKEAQYWHAHAKAINTARETWLAGQ